MANNNISIDKSRDIKVLDGISRECIGPMENLK